MEEPAYFEEFRLDNDVFGSIDRQRYRQILWFFAGIIAQLILVDLFLGRVPVLRRRIRASRPARFRQMAGRFRALAVQMGGVLIKLGQFLSSRVDVLPPEITDELRGLQDEVSPVPFGEVQAVLSDELREVDRHFSQIEEKPLASASLGQAHRAWLLPANGDTPLGNPVIVKVQRPNIGQIVQTDLAALRVVARWAMRYKPIRRRADVPALMDEFARTLWEELDYRAEAANAERFALMYADVPDVRIPTIYWQHSSGRVLTLEDVSGMKVDDVAGMESAGISPAHVAQRLLDIYFAQIFQEGFFHADPHPGNIFVRPRLSSNGTSAEEGAPYEIAFIDFGMIGRIQELMGANLRRVLLSVVQRDARALTEVYSDMGFFLPDADLERITEAQSVVLERIWGRSLLEMANPDMDEMKELGGEFKDILLQFPFQVPQDFIYLGRAMGMVSGLTTQLHPEIDPWQQLERFARQLLQTDGVASFSSEMLWEGLQEFLALPAQIQRLVRAAEQGELQLQVKDPIVNRRLERVERQMGQLNAGIFAGVLAVCGTIFYVNGDVKVSVICWVIAGISWLFNRFR